MQLERAIIASQHDSQPRATTETNKRYKAEFIVHVQVCRGQLHGTGCQCLYCGANDHFLL